MDIGGVNAEIEKSGKAVGSGDVAISNSFRALNPDWMEENIREEMVIGEENKVNEDVMNITSNEMSNIQAKEILINGKEARGNGGFKGGVAGRRPGGPKNIKAGGPKIKGPRTNKPTRGLVFGPIRGESDAVSSGKRLRVETKSVGRKGGVFSMGQLSSETERSPLQNRSDLINENSEEMLRDRQGSDVVLQEKAPDLGGGTSQQ